MQAPDLPGFWTDERTGIKVCAIGEEGEWTVALGWYSVDAFLAAANRYARTELGLYDLTDGCDTVAGIRSSVQYMRFSIGINRWLPGEVRRLEWNPGMVIEGTDEWHLWFECYGKDNIYRPFKGMYWTY